VTAPSSSMASVLARVSSLEAQFGLRRPPVATTATEEADFDAALQGALGTSSVSAASSTSFDLRGGGSAITDAAQDYLGIPYLWGGTDPSVGLDCSGFVGNVFRDLGVELPRVSRDQAQVGEPVASLADARPGDLLFFNEPVSHVAIYMGGNEMIHAAGTGKDVRITDVYETPTHIRRVAVPAASSAALPWSSAPAAPTSYDALFASAGARHGVDPALLAAVARTESGLDPSAVSPAGAQGLMQLMPATAAGLGVADAFDPTQAVDGAARLLRGHLDRFGSVELALAAYNAGGGAVSRYGGIPPYAETQAYVRRVMDQLGVAA
jgi:hypothetical protein